MSGSIDLSVCAQVLGEAATRSNELFLGLGIVVGLLMILVVGIGFSFIFVSTENKLYKDYLRRQALLNKYEDWKKDREIRGGVL